MPIPKIDCTDVQLALTVPCMIDRAQQALYLLALEPISETQADINSYGFRPGRCTADAIAQCFTVLARHGSAQYIFSGDIKSCFDKISHEWLEGNIPTDRVTLRKWLKAGFMDKKIRELPVSACDRVNFR